MPPNCANKEDHQRIRTNSDYSDNDTASLTCIDENDQLKSRSPSPVEDGEQSSGKSRGLGRKMASFKRPSRPAGLLRSFSSKGVSRPSPMSSSSFGADLTAADAAALVAEEFNMEEEDGKLDEMLAGSRQSRSSAGSDSDDVDDDDDDDEGGSYGDLDDSKSAGGPSPLADILAALGPSPTPDELSEVAGNRAKEKLDKYLSDASGAGICSVKFNALPEYSKSDVIMGTHLGKGSFSDAFEVTLKMKEDKPRATAESLNNDAEDLEAIFANLETKFSGPVAAPVSHARTSSDINGGRQRRPARRNSALSASVCVGSLSSQAPAARRPGDRTLTLAMKCLRPQIRSNPEQFLIGVEDLVHETAMLASLDHLHIIKLHGRASGNLTNAFKLGDGYFILLDRLKDTLDDRLGRWKKNYPGGKHPPSLNQLKAATAIADALAYLHSCNIVFRDLKPANVGFDSTGVLKLFDFGFAIGVEPSSADGSNDHLLYDKCGTPRYMAPEVGLMKGYGIDADVYSFGILLWEICALKKPFAKIKSAGEFHKAVFEKGERPKVGKKWPKNLQETATSCWSTNPKDRPTMANVKTMLTALVRETTNNGGDANLRKSSMFRRFTWDV